MAESPARSESLGDSAEDNPLTIRLPNPKTFLARQSQWKGRRGKPRCDHCRLNNLKCDRVLPTCNHCSWATRECKYTPLPTPAHRGIPRCDRCRFHNLKCDRNLPICNHCAEDDGAECNYTPKKRHKVPTDHAPPVKDRTPAPYATKSASFLISDVPDEEKYSTGNWIAEHPEDARGKLTGGAYDNESNGSQNSENEDDRMDEDPTSDQRGAQSRTELQTSTSDPSGSRQRYDATRTTTRHIEPWYHSEFAPLPRAILQGIRTVNPSDMPIRHDYDKALLKFLSELPAELREISAFAPDDYVSLARAVEEGDTSTLSERLRSWVTHHHVRTGSRKYRLLLLPREQYFVIRPEKEEKLRTEFIAEVDGDVFLNKPPSTNGQTKQPPREGASAFIRIPVSPQIYDTLVYAHKSHSTPAATLAQVRQAGIGCITWPMIELFHRLCPLCNSRSKVTTH
ncbi:hypothetical protein BC834DRAFT_645184 [Gloeopeniophorella convolvens]|nr:hypothetical protein BC834DRAFT_645184 [Gloeopeniophorella convolvens]